MDQWQKAAWLSPRVSQLPQLVSWLYHNFAPINKGRVSKKLQANNKNNWAGMKSHAVSYFCSIDWSTVLRMPLSVDSHTNIICRKNIHEYAQLTSGSSGWCYWSRNKVNRTLWQSLDWLPLACSARIYRSNLQRLIWCQFPSGTPTHRKRFSSAPSPCGPWIVDRNHRKLFRKWLVTRSMERSNNLCKLCKAGPYDCCKSW